MTNAYTKYEKDTQTLANAILAAFDEHTPRWTDGDVKWEAHPAQEWMNGLFFIHPTVLRGVEIYIHLCVEDPNPGDNDLVERSAMVGLTGPAIFWLMEVNEHYGTKEADHLVEIPVPVKDVKGVVRQALLVLDRMKKLVEAQETFVQQIYQWADTDNMLQSLRGMMKR